MKKTEIQQFFTTLREANPTPQTELEYTTVFELLAAVLLSAQHCHQDGSRRGTCGRLLLK